MGPNERRALAKTKVLPCLTARTLRDLVVFGSSDRLMSARGTLEKLGLIDHSATAAEVFDQAYALLISEYPAEYLLLNEALCEHGLHSMPANSVAYRELAIGTCKADLAIFEGATSCGYEIKSRFDRLDRLPAQLATYQQVFARTYVVADSVHLAEVLVESQETVGVLEFSAGELREHRPAKVVPDQLRHERIFALLRKPEYTSLVRRRFGALPKVPNTQIYRACLSKFHQLDISEALAVVCEIVSGRRAGEPEQRAWRVHLPRPLNSLVLTGNLSDQDLQTLVGLLGG